MRLVPVLLLLGCTPAPNDPPADTSEVTPTPDATPTRDFVRVAGDPAPDPVTERLCVTPDEDAPDFDPVRVPCDDVTWRFAPDDPDPPNGPIQVMAFNVERGRSLDAILAAFDGGALPTPDVLLLSELDRGCPRTGGRDVTGELASALGMDGIFVVEFVELPRGPSAQGQAPCEHGNAILSRFPLGNARRVLHEQNLSWYQPPDDRLGGEPRLGGRALAVADAAIGDDLLRLVSLHFESTPASWDEVLPAQALESALEGLAPGGPAIVGGDTNFPVYSFDLGRDDGDIRDRGAAAFLDRGYEDAHAALPVSERGTRGGLIIDLIFGVEVTLSSPGVCARSLCDDLSDHQAVWAGVAW